MDADQGGKEVRDEKLGHPDTLAICPVLLRKSPEMFLLAIVNSKVVDLFGVLEGSRLAWKERSQSLQTTLKSRRAPENRLSIDQSLASFSVLSSQVFFLII